MRPFRPAARDILGALTCLEPRGLILRSCICPKKTSPSHFPACFFGMHLCGRSRHVLRAIVQDRGESEVRRDRGIRREQHGRDQLDTCPIYQCYSRPSHHEMTSRSELGLRRSGELRSELKISSAEHMTSILWKGVTRGKFEMVCAKWICDGEITESEDPDILVTGRGDSRATSIRAPYQVRCGLSRMSRASERASKEGRSKSNEAQSVKVSARLAFVLVHTDKAVEAEAANQGRHESQPERANVASRW